jgi:hypothetical protein
MDLMHPNRIYTLGKYPKAIIRMADKDQGGLTKERIISIFPKRNIGAYHERFHQGYESTIRSKPGKNHKDAAT